jgi:hypothetical protein
LTAVLAAGTLRLRFAASRPGTRSRFNLEFADLLPTNPGWIAAGAYQF